MEDAKISAKSGRLSMLRQSLLLALSIALTPLLAVTSVNAVSPSSLEVSDSAGTSLQGFELPTQLSAVTQERRTALVIGNSNYKNEGKLRNPLNDARDMKKALEDLGFEVTMITDANRSQMNKAIREFSRQLRQGGVGLFYFAGHGVQVNQKNYLIPIDADIEETWEVEGNAVPLNNVLSAMKEAKNRVNLVLLDACRKNPYGDSERSPSRGLASIEKAKGTFISFAAAPGQVAKDGRGRNSPYTSSVLRHIKEPGLPVELMFKEVRRSVAKATENEQNPWEQSSLTGDFFFNPARGLPPLISRETGVDYTKLRNLLAQKSWQAADEETARVILQASGRINDGWLRIKDADLLACEDLLV